MTSGPVLIKVGGSLLDWPLLPTRLGDYLERRSDQPLALLVGGGRVVDAIRELDARHQIGEEPAHHLAIRALDVTAHALAAMLPGLTVVTHRDELDQAWRFHQTPILTPRSFLVEDDPELPKTWQTTSDSIAARIAVTLGARELVLLKSAPAPPATDRQQAAALGLVDPVFPAASYPLAHVTYLNFRSPDLIETPLPNPVNAHDRAGCLDASRDDA